MNEEIWFALSREDAIWNFMKYKDRVTDKGLLFPKKSNQKMNKCLKKIACKLG